MLRDFFQKLGAKVSDYLLNHTFQPHTFLAAVGFYVHVKYPQYRNEIDAAIASILAHERA